MSVETGMLLYKQLLLDACSQLNKENFLTNNTSHFLSPLNETVIDREKRNQLPYITQTAI